ncbi:MULTISPECIES: ATP-binding protein [unclassified Streptomyces]|uniref:ATP-binding protein n=1 Tax=unclassified Streptomyces TaxID=2593676 RepID=UPI00352C183F|nr:ATP-binding protein [Streptomyces sp. NBC_01213]
MGLLATTHGTEQERPESGPAVVADSAAYDMDSEQICRARDFVRAFLSDARSRHGVNVPARSMDIAQLVVSELATNVCKYAPGPCLLDLEVDGGLLGITMWDSGAVLPAALGADPGRAGQHGLEIVLAVCQSFEVRREPVGKRVRVQISLLEGRDAEPAGPTPW